MPIAYYDGAYVEKESIHVSPLDFGFSRGVAVYEFTRVYQGIPFRLEDHIERLHHAAKEFGIVCPSLSDIKAIVARLIAEHRYPQSTIKFFLTAGECGRFPGVGFGSCADFTPHFMAIEDEVHPAHPGAPKGMDLYKEGIALKTVSFSRQMPSVKSINYAPGFCAARDAAKEGFDEILFTHRDGFVTETTMSNFFCVIDGVLATPKREMLLGVSRKVVLELAAKIGIPTAERDIPLLDLERASEGFISGSYAELVPVRKINETFFAKTTDAPVYSALRQAFTAYIEAYRG